MNICTIRKVSGITLDTKVGEVVRNLPRKNSPHRRDNSCKIDFDLLPPNSFRGVCLGNIIYLDEPVSVLTSRAYLSNYSNYSHPLSHLFLLKTGVFYPVTPSVVIPKNYKRK